MARPQVHLQYYRISQRWLLAEDLMVAQRNTLPLIMIFAVRPKTLAFADF